MPKTGPQSVVAETADLDESGWPRCLMPECRRKLRAQFGGYGYDGNGHFCTKQCAAEWAEFKCRAGC